MSVNPHLDWGVRRSSRDEQWHMVQTADEHLEAGFCGITAAGSVYGRLGEAMDARGDVYTVVDDGFCMDCRAKVLDHFGLPETREAANAMLPDGREVF